MSRTFSLILCLLLFPFLLASSYQQLGDIQKTLYKNKQTLYKKKFARKKVQQSIGALSKQLRLSELQLKKTKTLYKSAMDQHATSKLELDRINNTYAANQKQLHERINFIYKYQPIGFVELLLTPKKVDVFAPYVFAKLLNQDLALIETTKNDFDLLKKHQASHQLKTQKIDAFKHTILTKERELAQKKHAKQRYYTKLTTQIQDIEHKNRALLKSSREITRLLKKRSRKHDKYYGSGVFIKPVKGWISSQFGMRKHPLFKRRIHHNGIDFAAPKGYKIRAADSGYVLVAGKQKRYKGYGNITIIDHGRRKKDDKRISTVYAHQSRILVKAGDFVKKGDVIGWVGDTGYATGPHLHFELRKDGIPSNPYPYLNL